MDTKPKKCKGTGKAKGYGCGELSHNRKYGLCIDANKCYQNFLFDTPEGKELRSNYIIKGSKKAKAEVAKDKRKKQREAVDDNKSIAQLKKEAKAPFQKLIRMRDHRKACICCDNALPWNIGDYDGGHGYKAEVYYGVIFHPDNVHGQRVYCNQHLHGNESGYMAKLPSRIGIERAELLKDLAYRTKDYKWDRVELIAMRNHYKSELSNVEKGVKPIELVDFTIGIIK